MSKYYEVTDGDIHVGYVSEEYVMKKYEEKILTGKAICNILIGEDEAIDVEPVEHGKWIWDDEGYHCSECFFHAYGNGLECLSGKYRYCPSCGAKMEVEE